MNHNSVDIRPWLKQLRDVSEFTTWLSKSLIEGKITSVEPKALAHLSKAYQEILSAATYFNVDRK
jgi:hypothetical protein